MHQEKLKKAKASLPNQQEVDQLLISQYNKKKMSKIYQLVETDRQMQADHHRLLSRFEEIQQGRLLSVGKSKVSPQERAMNSPVAALNSLNFVKKLKELKEIDLQNQMMIQKLNSPKTSINNKNLNNEWVNIFNYQN